MYGCIFQQCYPYLSQFLVVNEDTNVIKDDYSQAP